MSARLAQMEREMPAGHGVPDPVWSEMFAAMVAVAAAAHALDGFYGTVKPLVSPPASTASRGRQVLEALKLGFKIGPHASTWLTGMDWLFKTRDRAVHHDEVFPTLVSHRVTEETVVFGAPELEAFSAASAERAAELATTILITCIENPKPATAEWAAMRESTLPVLRGDDGSAEETVEPGR
jgi:hypothetical protein